MERIKLFTAALLLAAISAGMMCGRFPIQEERHASGRITPILQWKRQPAVGFHFCGRPDIGGIQRKALCVWNQ